MALCQSEPAIGGPDAITLSRLRNHSDPVGLSLWSAHILVEPLDGARPCLLGRGLVVAFRRRDTRRACGGRLLRGFLRCAGTH
jgi:hypothetical protein